MVEEPKLEGFEFVEPDLIETDTKNKWRQVSTLEPSDFEFALTQQDVVISLPPPEPPGEYSDGCIRLVLLTCKVAHVLRVRTLWNRVSVNLGQYAEFQAPEVKAKKEQAKLNRLNKLNKPTLALQDGGDGIPSDSRHSRGSKE